MDPLWSHKVHWAQQSLHGLPCTRLDFLVEVQQSISYSTETSLQWDNDAFYWKFWNLQSPFCSNRGTIEPSPMLSVSCGRCFHTSRPSPTSRWVSPWLCLDLRADVTDRTLNHFLPSLCFALQRKRTASCGLLSGRVTRASLCRALSAACPARWSWLAGERLIVHSTRGKSRDPSCIHPSSRLRTAFHCAGTVLGWPSLFILFFHLILRAAP